MKKIVIWASTLLLLPAAAFAKSQDWDNPRFWKVETDGGSALELRATDGMDGLRLELRYGLQGPGHRWVQMRTNLEPGALVDGRPITFLFRTRTTNQAILEVKVIDEDGSHFICRYPLRHYQGKWEPVVLYKDSFEYAWGGDAALGRPQYLALAVAGPAEVGTLLIDEIGLGRKGQPATPTPDGPRLDPKRSAGGFGLAARRAKKASPEDPGVLEWLKAVQDAGSLQGRLLPSMEDNRAQTFNNALAAIVFILKDERERAERILGFFAEATRRDNKDPLRQNFFYKGEPRGFFQEIYLRDEPEGKALTATTPGDRWMGDMAWLLIAYKYYGRRFDPAKYEEVTRLLENLLVSYYTPAGGYVRHGWRRRDARLHETVGHTEGNIDAYAALRLAGREDLAKAIARWLQSAAAGTRQPLDVYSWRVMAMGKSYADALSIPETDLRYRKTLLVDGTKTAGFFHTAAGDVENFWLDGTAHMACAYYAAGDDTRGHFYANELDKFLIDREVGGRRSRALPYTANQDGGFDWVKLDRGFTSTACWYIFAKERFNPMALTVALEAAR